MAWKHAALGAVAVTVLSLSSAPADAVTPEDQALAEALFIEGRRLFKEGKVDEACPKFAESHRLDPATGTLLNLATCHEKQGKLAAAWAEFKVAASDARRDRQTARASYAQERAEALEPRIGRLRLAVGEGAKAVPGLEITLDGRPLRAAVWTVPVPVDPGRHTLRATAPDRTPWRHEVKVDEGQTTEPVVVPVLPESAPSVPEEPGSRPAGEPEPPPDRRDSPDTPVPSAPSAGLTPWQIVGLSVGGAGVATAVVGGFFGVQALSFKGDRDRECDASNRCTADGVRLDGDARDAATLATVLTTVGGVLAVGGLTLVLLAPDRAASGRRLSLRVAGTPWSTGLEFRGTF